MSTPHTPCTNLIYARSRNGVIGRENALPWHLPEDMAHFKKSTQDAPVVMGRKTWESLPSKFRPLPGRINIVVTRSPDWEAEGAVTATSIQEAIEKFSNAAQIWVMGGAQIYEAALPFAHRAYVTEILETYEGDTYAPELAETEWQEYESSETLVSSTGLKYRFVIYERIAPPQAAAENDTSTTKDMT